MALFGTVLEENKALLREGEGEGRERKDRGFREAGGSWRRTGRNRMLWEGGGRRRVVVGPWEVKNPLVVDSSIP